jgi:hypothetical protein
MAQAKFRIVSDEALVPAVTVVAFPNAAMADVVETLPELDGYASPRARGYAAIGFLSLTAAFWGTVALVAVQYLA